MVGRRRDESARKPARSVMGTAVCVSISLAAAVRPLGGRGVVQGGRQTLPASGSFARVHRRCRNDQGQ
jgi:hypothetical protein